MHKTITKKTGIPYLVRCLRLVHFYTVLTNDFIYRALEERRIELGLSQAELGVRAFGKQDNSAMQGIRRGASPSVQKLEALAEALGLELYFGPRRPDAKVEKTHHLLSDYVLVDRFDLALSAGPGQNGENAERLSPVAYRREWLSRRGLSPAKCVVLSVDGDSMAPTLEDGALVMIDRRRTKIRNLDVYGFVDVSGDARIKRLEILADELLLRSDNPAHPTEVRRGDDANRIKIIGRVVWSAHDWK